MKKISLLIMFLIILFILPSCSHYSRKKNYADINIPKRDLPRLKQPRLKHRHIDGTTYYSYDESQLEYLKEKDRLDSQIEVEERRIKAGQY